MVFVAESADVKLFFPEEGTYYLYHSKLEVGNKATGWSPSPFDYTRTEDLADVALSGDYEDLTNKPSIPQSVQELDVDGTILYKGDITQKEKEDGQGNKYLETKVPIGDGEYITYATYDAGEYVLFGELGEDAEGKDYFCLDKKGLLTARNAVIYGEIHATSGIFHGEVVTGKLTIENNAVIDGLKFKNLDDSEEIEEDIKNAGKTASNFIEFDPSSGMGLLIGYKEDGEWVGTRAQIVSEAYNILDEEGRVTAKFSHNFTGLGMQGGNNAEIDLLNGIAKFYATQGGLGIRSDDWFHVYTGDSLILDAWYIDDDEMYARARITQESREPASSNGFAYPYLTLECSYGEGGYISGSQMPAFFEKSQQERTRIRMSGSEVKLIYDAESAVGDEVWMTVGNLGINFSRMPGIDNMKFAPVCSGSIASADIAKESYRSVTINFPFAFTSVPNVVAGLYSSSSDHKTGSVSVAVGDVTTTTAIVRIYNNGDETRAPAVFWIATQN